MATLTHTFTAVDPPGSASASFFLRDGQTADFTAVGTIDAGCEVFLQRHVGAGAWRDLRRWAAGTINDAAAITASGGDATLRFACSVPVTDPATALTSFVVTLAERAKTLSEVHNVAGERVLAVTDEGIEAPVVTADQVVVGAVTIEQGSVKLTGGSIQHLNGTAAGVIAQAFGKTIAEGLQIYILEETISFAGNVALYKAMTATLPAGAVILSAQANIESALTGGGTTVKVGLGLNASDPDKYGLSTVLTKNAKITTVPAHAVLAGATRLDLCSCATAGGAGDTALTVGSVRVRIVFSALFDLADAA